MQHQSVAQQQRVDPDLAATVIAPTSSTARDMTLLWRPAMLQILVIALGAAIGANLRYGVSLWAAQHVGSAFPFGTLFINIVGSCGIGMVMALITTRIAVAEPVRVFMVTGLLGGFTTFSSFSYEAYTLATAGDWLLAAVYVGGSVVCGLIGVMLGVSLVQLLP
jgi:fluoride exporter